MNKPFAQAPHWLSWTPDLVESFWRAVYAHDLPPAKRDRAVARHVVSALHARHPPPARVLVLGDRDPAYAETLLFAGYEAARADSGAYLRAMAPEAAHHCLWRGAVALSAGPFADIVFAPNALSQLLDDEIIPFFAALRAALKPEGRLFLWTPNGERLEHALAICPMSGALFHPEQRVRSFDRTRLDALLTSEGFHLEAAFEIEPTEHAFASRPDFSRAFKEDAHVYFGNGNTLIAVARRSPLQARPTANKPASAGAFADRPAPDKGNDLAAAESWLKRRRLCSQSAEQETRPATRFDWTDDAIRSFWSHVAHSPLNDLSFGLTGGAEFVAIAKAWLKPGGRHLDIGAGEGHIADLLIAAGFPTAILEAAPERLIEIRAKLDGKPGFLGAIDDIAADAAHTFDVVLATEVIEHVTETAMASFFEMIGKALKPGGRLILTTPNNETLESMLVYSPLARVIFHRWQHLRSHDGEALCALLSRFGFEAEAVHEIDLASLAAGASPFFELLTSSRAPTRIGNGSNLFAVFRRQREMLALESHGTRV